MDHPTAKDVVLNAWKTFSTRDAGQIAALFTPDAEWIAPARNATAVALAHTDHMIGPDQIARFIASEMHRLFSAIDISFRAVHADGDTVIIEERMRATLPEGRPYDNDYCFVFVVEGGRIKQVREYMDTRKGWQMVFGEPRSERRESGHRGAAARWRKRKGPAAGAPGFGWLSPRPAR